MARVWGGDRGTSSIKSGLVGLIVAKSPIVSIEKSWTGEAMHQLESTASKGAVMEIDDRSMWFGAKPRFRRGDGRLFSTEGFRVSTSAMLAKREEQREVALRRCGGVKLFPLWGDTRGLRAGLPNVSERQLKCSHVVPTYDLLPCL